MLGRNIKQFRKNAGMSQEKMAEELHVVRQTVSKWENGLSVPDADDLMRISELLDIPVNRLLGVNEKSRSEECTDHRKYPPEEIRKDRMMILAYRKRGLIIFLSFLTMLAILLIGNETVSLLSAGVCVLLTVSVLYRNLALLTGMTADDSRLRILRASTLFDIAVFLTGTVLSLLIASHTVTLSGQTEKALAASMVSSVMIFAGIAAPKLPHSKHTGLRLPWTVQDEDTWNAAHRMIGCISIPAALLYIACAWTVSDFAFVTLCAMIVWIGIPAGISYIFFFRKYHGIRH